MSDELTRPRTLESLKKEAKQWLDALRHNAADARSRLQRALPNAPASPTLRDVQHALAREQGFAGWPELKEKLSARAALSATTIRQFNAQAEVLLEAYRTGTPEAMERHWALTWHRRGWHGMRTLRATGERAQHFRCGAGSAHDAAGAWLACVRCH